MTALTQRTVGEVFEQASSTAPSPGAGSVMALAGMWGAGLVLKAIRITRRHGEISPQMQAAEAELERLAALLAQDAEDDATAFAAYVAARQRPRSDPGRGDAASQAAAAAAEAAVRALEHAREGLLLCRAVQGEVAEVMAADVEAGAALLQAAARTAGEDARESLASIGAEAVRQGVLQRLARAGEL